LIKAFPIAERDGCLWEEVERQTNSRMARVCSVGGYKLRSLILDISPALMVL